MRLEQAGRPTVLVATGDLRQLADQTAADLGLADWLTRAGAPVAAMVRAPASTPSH